MPGEKFYPTSGETKAFLEVGWHRDYPGVYCTLVLGDTASGIDLDRSALNRLIKTLRKARDQTYGADE